MNKMIPFLCVGVLIQCICIFVLFVRLLNVENLALLNADNIHNLIKALNTKTSEELPDDQNAKTLSIGNGPNQYHELIGEDGLVYGFEKNDELTTGGQTNAQH